MQRPDDATLNDPVDVVADVPTGRARRSPGSWLRRLRDWRLLAGVLVVVGAGGFVASLLAAPGRPVVGDTSPRVAKNGPVTTLEAGDEVVQTIAAAQDQFSAVQVTFGTYFGTARCTLRVELRADDGDPVAATGPLVAAEDVSCADLPDSSPTRVLEFAPLDGSAGKSYDVVVLRTDDDQTQGVALWGGEALDDSPAAAVDGETDERTALVRPLYDPEPRWWDQLGTTMSRMVAYGPSWATPAVFGTTLLVLVGGVAAVPWLVRRPRAFLVAVAVVALVRGLLWSAAVPAFSGMDEPAHFANVQHIAVEHALPGRGTDAEVYSDQVFVAIDELNLVATPPGDRPPFTAGGEREVTQVLDDASTTGGGGGPAAAYPPFYYLGAAAFYPLGGGEFFSTVVAVRLWSVLLGIVAAVVLTLVGRRLFPGSPVAQAAFAVAGVLQPMAAHQFAIVNNDAWVILAGFTAFLVALMLAERDRSPGLALAAGLVLGAAVLGKPFGVAVAVPLGIGWILGKVRYRVRSVRVLAGEAALVVAGFAATYGGWQVVARLLGISAQKVPAEEGLRSTRLFLESQVGEGGAALRTMWGDQLWGNFGWVRIPYSLPVTWTLFGAGVLVAVGLGCWLLVVARQRWRARRAPVVPSETVAGPVRSTVDVDVRLAVTTAMLVGIVVALYAAAWVYYRSSGANDLLQGRYALLALPAMLAAPPLLAERFLGRRWATVVTVVLAVAMLALTLGGLDNTMHAFYG